MDINDLYTQDKHDAGAEMRVRGPDGIETDCYIMLVGIDSKKWREILKERAKDSAINDNMILAKATLGWRGFTNGDDNFEFSEAAALALYKKAPYIAQQADLFISRRVNFIKS